MALVKDSWWIGPLAGLVALSVMYFIVWIAMRKRRWRDWRPLAKPAIVAAEHIAHEPRTVRDLLVGDVAYVGSYDVVTSKRRRVFVRWDATLRDAPENPNAQFAPLRIERLRRGFSMTIRPGDEFRTSPVPWGWYAPVIDILQATPPQEFQTK